MVRETKKVDKIGNNRRIAGVKTNPYTRRKLNRSERRDVQQALRNIPTDEWQEEEA